MIIKNFKRALNLNDLIVKHNKTNNGKNFEINLVCNYYYSVF